MMTDFDLAARRPAGRRGPRTAGPSTDTDAGTDRAAVESIPVRDLWRVTPLRRSSDEDPWGGAAAPEFVATALRRRAGQGQPLPAPLAASMGEHLGSDLSTLRVHTDSEAGRIASSVQARAFTHGNDVYFAPGQFRPSSTEGQRVIAHEVSHVAAQRRGEDRAAAGPLAVGRADDPAEAAADRSADRVMAALRRSPAPGSASSDAPEPAEARAAGEWVAVRRWPWSKKKDAAEEPGGPARPTRKTFADAVSGTAPASRAEASTRMKSLRVLIGAMDTAERAAIAGDAKLMAKARTFVGAFEYMTLVAALGTYVAPSKAAVKRGDAAVHMSGAEADTFIQQNMGAIGHLKGYIATAVGAGKKADGFVAVVGDKDWARIYDQQYVGIGRKAGINDTLTNAFIANTHPDRPAIINHDRGTRSTAIHESMHRYSELAALKAYGSPINEGITEYFTRLITDKDGNPLGGKPSDRDNYQRNWEFVCAMLPMLGADPVAQQTELAEIYFAGKVGRLKTDFETACAAAGLDPGEIADRWTRFTAAIKSEDWANATALLPPPPRPAPQQPTVAPSDSGSGSGSGAASGESPSGRPRRRARPVRKPPPPPSGNAPSGVSPSPQDPGKQLASVGSGAQ